MSNELLTLKNLKQYFPVGKDRFVRAVDGVDLTINHGDVMGLVGESGSGKSTIAYTVMAARSTLRARFSQRRPSGRGA